MTRISAKKDAAFPACVFFPTNWAPRSSACTYCNNILPQSNNGGLCLTGITLTRVATGVISKTARSVDTRIGAIR